MAAQPPMAMPDSAPLRSPRPSEKGRPRHQIVIEEPGPCDTLKASHAPLLGNVVPAALGAKYPGEKLRINKGALPLARWGGSTMPRSLRLVLRAA